VTAKRNPAFVASKVMSSLQLPILQQRLFYLLAAWLVGILSTTLASSTPCGGVFSIAGSVSTNRLARIWEASYRLQQRGGDCPEQAITAIDDATSSTGAARVCGVRRDASAVDVATMTRPMNRVEATTTNGWKYSCQLSVRKTIQVSKIVLEE
jgi:hypothetical protein